MPVSEAAKEGIRRINNSEEFVGGCSCYKKRIVCGRINGDNFCKQYVGSTGTPYLVILGAA